jgi:AraC-like DNA-binding protein
MELLFSTHDVQPPERFDYWHSVACKSLVKHDSVPECSERFHAQIEMSRFDDIALIRFENAPMTVARTPRQVANERTDEIFLCQQIAGRLDLRQEGREFALEPGHFALVDPILPYEGKFYSGSQLAVFKIRRRALEARLGKTREMVALALKPVQAENALTSAFLAMLPTYAGEMSSTAQQMVRNQAIDLIAVSLAKATERQPRLSSPRKFILLSLQAAIDSRLAEPTLDAAEVAAAAGISVRYANYVLAELDTSVARLIQTKRLERCRKALRDPLQSNRTVREIACGWGFSDMTHFGRRFKGAYGMLPSEYRQVLLPIK